MPSLTLAAPAKLNLHLEIIRRRDDGFHELETIFQTVGLHDRVRVDIAPGNSITLTCDDSTLPTDHRNLAWRAASAFFASATPSCSVTIHLEKRIPHGAGLGGGSSDAAAVLRALVRLLPGHRSATELAALAGELGSDVPFFLLGGTAVGHGRGEQLTALTDLPRQAVTIFMPDGSVSTPAAYGALTTTERGPRHAKDTAWWSAAIATGEVSALLKNRLTGPAQRLCPALGELLEWLKKTDVPYLMSGSGAACFALGHLTQTPPNVRRWHTWFRTRADLDQIGAP